jgi:deoxyribose-phosphate aldolase
MYSKEQFAKMIDSTLLRPDTTTAEIVRLCDESQERHFACVCLLPCWVGTAARLLEGTDVKVCTVVSFPFGADTRLTKAYMVKNAIANGAREIDAVMAIGRFKSGGLEYVADDIRGMVDACNTGGTDGETRRVQLKVIIETHFLTDEEKQVAARLARDAGADFVKTSTGTAGGGATVADIRLLRRALGSTQIGVKASGGIRTIEAALQMLDAGANRIGTSSGAALCDAYRPEDFAAAK